MKTRKKRAMQNVFFSSKRISLLLVTILTSTAGLFAQKGFGATSACTNFSYTTTPYIEVGACTPGNVNPGCRLNGFIWDRCSTKTLDEGDGATGGHHGTIPCLPSGNIASGTAMCSGSGAGNNTCQANIIGGGGYFYVDAKPWQCGLSCADPNREMSAFSNYNTGQAAAAGTVCACKSGYTSTTLDATDITAHATSIGFTADKTTHYILNNASSIAANSTYGDDLTERTTDNKAELCLMNCPSGSSSFLDLTYPGTAGRPAHHNCQCGAGYTFDGTLCVSAGDPCSNYLGKDGLNVPNFVKNANGTTCQCNPINHANAKISPAPYPLPTATPATLPSCTSCASGETLSNDGTACNAGTSTTCNSSDLDPHPGATPLCSCQQPTGGKKRVPVMTSGNVPPNMIFDGGANNRCACADSNGIYAQFDDFASISNNVASGGTANNSTTTTRPYGMVALPGLNTAISGTTCGCPNYNEKWICTGGSCSCQTAIPAAQLMDVSSPSSTDATTYATATCTTAEGCSLIPSSTPPALFVRKTGVTYAVGQWVTDANLTQSYTRRAWKCNTAQGYTFNTTSKSCKLTDDWTAHQCSNTGPQIYPSSQNYPLPTMAGGGIADFTTNIINKRLVCAAADPGHFQFLDAAGNPVIGSPAMKYHNIESDASSYMSKFKPGGLNPAQGCSSGFDCYYNEPGAAATTGDPESWAGLSYPNQVYLTGPSGPVVGLYRDNGTRCVTTGLPIRSASPGATEITSASPSDQLNAFSALLLTGITTAQTQAIQASLFPNGTSQSEKDACHLVVRSTVSTRCHTNPPDGSVRRAFTYTDSTGKTITRCSGASQVCFDIDVADIRGANPTVASTVKNAVVKRFSGGGGAGPICQDPTAFLGGTCPSGYTFRNGGCQLNIVH